MIEVDGFFDEDGKWFATNKVIYKELIRTLPKLPLDKLGRCEYCAKAQDDYFCAV